MPPPIEAFVLEELERDSAWSDEQRQARKASLERAYSDVQTQLHELTGLRLRALQLLCEEVKPRFH